MINHKLEIKPVLNGYEFSVKDVTGFGPEGYSADTLNVNNVKAVLLVLKDAGHRVMNSIRLEGQDKNDFMTGLLEVSIASQDSEDTWKEFKTGQYSIDTYLLTKVIPVKGLANYSTVTGTGLDVALGDNFIVDDKTVYTVMDGYTNGGTILQLTRPIERFFNEGGFGYSYSQYVLNYVKTVKTLLKLSLLRLGTLQKDGEAENFAVLNGYLNVIKWREDTLGAGISKLLRETDVLTDHLNNRYFRR